MNFQLFVVLALALKAVAGHHLQDFPEHLATKCETFKNWAGDIVVDNLFTVYPRNAEDVTLVVNWARKYNFTVRASGQMHTWAPLTVDKKGELHEESSRQSKYGKKSGSKTKSSHMEIENRDLETERTYEMMFPSVLLLKTSMHLNTMGIISDDPNDASFWAEPGILMEVLVEKLEARGLGFLHLPAPGDITLGGALAVGAHGTGVPAVNETLRKGHTYGSISNLIIAFTAVVYDKDTDSYAPREFHRSEPEADAFLVSLGRTFMTNVTMRVGPLQNIRCQSFYNIHVNELFASPEEEGKKQTISKFLNKTGRIEVILFPFTSYPWFKIWTVSPQKPKESREVHRSYNYVFAENIPAPVAMIIGFLTREGGMTTAVGPFMAEYTNTGLRLTNTNDIWGTSRTVLHYVKPTTLRVTANGYAIHTTRKNVQKVLHESFKIYKGALDEYRRKGKYPINGPLEVRVTGIDDPGDVMVPGARPSGLAATAPVYAHAGYDTVVWLDILTFAKSYNIYEFMDDVERRLYDTFTGDYAFIRVEWSKGYAYNSTSNTAWENDELLSSKIPKGLNNWQETMETLNEFDPDGIYMNQFLARLFGYDRRQDGSYSRRT